MEWNKILGTAIDVAGGVSGVNAISYGVTGKTIGSHLTGGSYASDLGDNILGRNPNAKDNLMNYQTETATTQGEEAARLKKELEAQGRPEMQAAVNRQRQITQMAEGYAREGMPEAQRQMAADNIAGNQQAQFAAASSLGAGLRNLGQIQTSTAQSYRQLNAQDAMAAQANQQQYMAQLGNLGALEGQAEGYNVLQPYAEKVAEMQALLGSSQQNEYNALNLDYQNQMASQQMAVDLFGAGMQGAGQAAGGIATVAMGSDIRIKENINHTGFSESGIPTYTWVYKADPNKKTHSGTMAQDLLEMGKKEAVIRTISGFYAVDYSKIDVDFK
jgi:hypothetical protein